MPASDPIQHVVLLMLENHSFDQMLGCFQRIYPDLDGVDPSVPRVNYDKSGKAYAQSLKKETQTRYDPKHEHRFVMEQLANNNGGFILDFVANYPDSSQEDREEVMGYYPPDFLPALHSLARDFTICDRWFSSLPGPTWPNRFFALSGTSMGRVLMPEGFEAPRPQEYFEQSQHTIFDRLREAGRAWKIYYYDFPSSWLLMRQLEPENLIHYHHISGFFQDTRPGGTFPDFAFIEPKYFGQDQNDDHPPHNVMKAEKLIADVYNAIRSNTQLWNSTLLVVVFDEHGGFYDHVVPPAAVPPDDHREENYSFDQLGVRVPAVLISPWVGRRVEHTVFDHTSLLQYLTGKWGLGPLGNRTAQAQSIGVAIQEPAARGDTVPFIRVPYTDLMPPHPEWEREDASNHRNALLAFARFLESQTGDPAFQQALELPGRLAQWGAAIGKRLIQAGSALVGSQEGAKAAQVARMENLVESIVKRRSLPAGPDAGGLSRSALGSS